MLAGLALLLLPLWPLLRPTAGRAAETASFRLGIVNERPDQPDLALGQYGRLHAYLAGALAARGIRLEALAIAQSLDDMIGLLRAGKVDGVAEGVFPTLYMSGRERLLAPALLAWRKGQREYRSVFFTRSDSPIRTLADLRGRIVAFESPRSTSAFHLPRAELRAAGIAAVPAAAGADKGGVRYVFAGSELNQGYWVERGQADAGAFNDGDWERLPAHLRRRLRVFHQTAPVLRWLFSFRRGLPEAVTAAVTDELVRMHENAAGRAALAPAEQIARFEPLGQADRAALKRLEALARGSLPR